MNKNKISVLGGGSWGTVLAYLASLNENEVTLWMRDEEVVREINNKIRHICLQKGQQLRG